MIRMEELRIGNIVSYRGEKDCIVSNIGNSFETVKQVGLNIQPYGSDDLNEYEPIPLTEEWLLKFGFVEELFNGEIKTSDFYKGRIGILGNIGDSNIRQLRFELKCCQVFIQYVHQLQNLYFALTNEELEVKQ